MGDTLTHLPSLDAVEQLFDQVAEALAPGGIFVATFRDYSGPVRRGVDRIIPVRQDDQRMLTCVLEYTDTAVVVHDLVHERSRRGVDAQGEQLPQAALRAAVGTHGPGPPRADRAAASRRQRHGAAGGDAPGLTPPFRGSHRCPHRD